MSQAASTLEGGVGAGLRSGGRNLVVNFQTPSFLANVVFVDLPASSDLLSRVPIGGAYSTALIGEIQLRGKAEALALSSVTRVDSAAA